MSEQLFSDSQVNLQALRQRAYNLRWATVPADVIPLTAADPDFRCAPEIAEAIGAYAAERVFSYGPPEGLPSFRETIARTMRSRRNIDTQASCVLPVDSAAQGMFIIARHLLQPGEEAIIFDPVDFLFRASVEAAGGKAVCLPIDVATGQYDLAALRSLITPRTRLFCLCNPHNPAGKVFSAEELRAIGDLALEYGLKIMSDEIWSDIVFPPHRFTSIASLSPELAAITYTVYGFSKSFGMAGLRVGFIIAPNEAENQGLLETSQMKTTAYGVSTLSQVAAEAAYTHCWYWVEAFVQHLTRMRDLCVEKLNAMKNVRCHSPAGCYVVFPYIADTGMESEALAQYLMEKARVAVVPGATRWFGPGAAGHMRICFSTSETILRQGLDRIGEALEKL